MTDSNPQTTWEDLLAGLPETQNRVLERVGHLREEGRLEEAAHRLQQALDRHATPKLRKIKGRIELARGNFIQAAETVEPLCDDEADPGALIIYARTQGALGQLEKARETLERARSAGATSRDVARVSREIEAFPDPTDEQSMEERSNLRHEWEPTLEVGDEWRELIESADSVTELRRAAEDVDAERSEASREREADTPETSEENRNLRKTEQVQAASRDREEGAQPRASTEEEDDHEIRPSKMRTTERFIDVPSPESGTDQTNAPDERTTAEGNSLERAEIPEGSLEEDTDPEQDEEQNRRLERPTEEADAEMLEAVRSESAMHRETVGPASEDNPFADMEDTVAEVETEGTHPEARQIDPGGDEFHRSDETGPEESSGGGSSAATTPADERSEAAEDRAGLESSDGTNSERRRDQKLGRSMERSEEDFYADAQPTGIDHSVQPPGSDERATADLPDPEESASDVFQISTDPEDTGLHLEDLLVDAPLDQDGTETKDISPSDFDEIETSPVHDYAEFRGDFQIAEADPDDLFGSESDARNADGDGLDPRPVGDGSTYRPEASTLPEPDDSSPPDVPSETDRKHQESNEAERDRREISDEDSTNRQQSTSPELPKLKRGSGDDPEDERVSFAPVDDLRGDQPAGDDASSSPPTADGLTDEDPTRDRPPPGGAGEDSPASEPRPPDGLTDDDPTNAKPPPTVPSESGRSGNRTADGLTDEDPTRDRKPPKDLGDRTSSPKRTEVSEEKTDPRKNIEELSHESERSEDDASPSRPPSPDADRSSAAPSSPERPIPPETNDLGEASDRERATPRRDERQTADISNAEPDRDPDLAARRSSSRVQSGQSRVRDRDEVDDAQPADDAGFVTRANRAFSLPNRLDTGESFLIAAISFATVCAAVLFVSGLIASLDADRLSETLDRIENTRATDTFSGWRESYDIAHSTLRDGPGPVRQFFQAVGALLPGGDPRAIQREIARQRAYTAAVVEYRFESFETRDSRRHAERIFGGPRVSGLAAAAATYRLLARGRFVEATGLAQSMHHDYRNHRPLARAYLEALMAAEHTAGIVREARDLRDEADELTVYDRYLLARAARFRKDTSASNLLDRLIEESSPQHLDARIDRVTLLIEKSEREDAIERAQDLLDDYGTSASKHQRARLHIALGNAYVSEGKLARAEEQYRTAVEVQPERTSVYLPLTELFIDDGRLSEATAHVRAAESKAEVTPRLQQLRARLQYLKGRLDSALSLLEADAAGAMIAPVLRGRILLERGEYEEARRELNSVGSSHPRYAIAQSFELLARAHMDVDDEANALDRSEELQELAPDAPLVLRSAARLRLHYARASTAPEDRSGHLERAGRLLDAADRSNKGHALTAYVRCDLELLDGSSDAAEHCRRARRDLPHYIPGRIVQARLELSRGAPERAVNLLESVRERVERRWDVDLLYVRAQLRSHDPEGADGVLEAWRTSDHSRSPTFRFAEGLVAFFRADYKEAATRFDEARNDERLAPEANLFRAHTLARLEKFGEATELLGELMEDSQWQSAARIIFGEIRRRQDRPEEALRLLELATDDVGARPVESWRISHAYAERALAWQLREGWDDARVSRNIRRGRDRGDPKAPDLRLARGRYLMHREEPAAKKAARELQAVVDIQPHRCEALKPLVDLYTQLDEASGRANAEELEQENCE